MNDYFRPPVPKWKRLEWHELLELDSRYIKGFKASLWLRVIYLSWLLAGLSLWVYFVFTSGVESLVRAVVLGAGVPVLVLFLGQTLEAVWRVGREEGKMKAALMLVMADLRLAFDWLEEMRDTSAKMVEVKPGEVGQDIIFPPVEAKMPSDSNRIASLNPALYSDLMVAYKNLALLMVPVYQWYNRPTSVLPQSEFQKTWSSIQDYVGRLIHEMVPMIRRLQEHLKAFGATYPYLFIITSDDPEWGLTGAQPSDEVK